MQIKTRDGSTSDAFFFLAFGFAVRDDKLRVTCFTLRNQIQETAFLVQVVLKLRFLVFDFGVYAAGGTERCAAIVVRCTACAMHGTDLAHGATGHSAR
eukprot:2570965-Rhodomonas_salina.1